ncbi:MAG: putative tRNA threonylcarbamoyladenosine biosynthesis protein Gcp [Candidatus Roizmanbacteria bacterium GW2011_GWC2_37_13]|uniref:tRNA N6-adenosine threonylcarbamoyltransferase n=1 Tax=Candidatus Roizmanbacteria bacterium GW2011_GWC2_37_13 TaxID=1618486 RepID=A0A0G0G617_9BACT|nr:MAG: putative tRNA threonylcarbamoyladenosine biosynthesis protein Gcp [Candidatus Roizmanbacteria bacterium GW2011_GWC1_37_12]KKQ26558.1 MAG: putative tRNA threonylcarbamoyladenosine biosynthesis protein Gcp [Candidatus Roizmanbacteria bacterium GW2011_GWC2_37_13]
MKILAIDTSCDETAAAVVDGRRVLSNVIYSQVLIHKKWGGVVPSLAKRAHEERIDFVVDEALRHSGKRTKFAHPESLLDSGQARMTTIQAIAITQGPGLAVALEVGIKKAKELAKKYNKRLIAVNHLEGHIYSAFVQNSQGNPKINFKFPYLALIISGGHTEFVKFNDHLKYNVIGSTLDDAAGEALDKVAKLLGLGYPGGPVIERLARDVHNKDFYIFPRPMLKSNDLNFSFSGLKTSFYYFVTRRHSGKAEGRVQNLHNDSGVAFAESDSATLPRMTDDLRRLCSSFQEAVFDTIIKKTEKAMRQTGINRLVIGGGVIANLRLRQLFRKLVDRHRGEVLFPTYKYLTGDNAAMIGAAASYKAEKELFVKDIDELDRIPRLNL